MLLSMVVLLNKTTHIIENKKNWTTDKNFHKKTELNIIHLLKAKNTFNVRDISNPHPQKKKSDN